MASLRSIVMQVVVIIALSQVKSAHNWTNDLVY